MNSMKTKSLNKPQKTLKASDICRIIDACKASGVTDFQMGSLRINFGESIRHANQWVDPKLPLPTPQEEADLAKQSARKLSEEQEADLIVSDPVAYEQSVLSGELEDA